MASLASYFTLFLGNKRTVSFPTWRSVPGLGLHNWPLTVSPSYAGTKQTFLCEASHRPHLIQCTASFFLQPEPDFPDAARIPTRLCGSVSKVAGQEIARGPHKGPGLPHPFTTLLLNKTKQPHQECQRIVALRREADETTHEAKRSHSFSPVGAEVALKVGYQAVQSKQASIEGSKQPARSRAGLE